MVRIMKSSSKINTSQFSSLLLIGAALISMFIYCVFTPSQFEKVKIGIFRVQIGDPVQVLASQMEQSISDNNKEKWKIYIDPKVCGRTSCETFVGGGNGIFLLRVARAYKCKCVVSTEDLSFRFVE